MANGNIIIVVCNFMSHIFGLWTSQKSYARAEISTNVLEISRKCVRFPHAHSFYWLAHRAKTGDKIYYLWPLPTIQNKINLFSGQDQVQQTETWQAHTVIYTSCTSLSSYRWKKIWFIAKIAQNNFNILWTIGLQWKQSSRPKPPTSNVLMTVVASLIHLMKQNLIILLK